MSATVQPASKPSSRRALLAGAIGGLGVWAASAIGRAAPAEAAAGDPIRMGRLNKASSTATTLQTKTSAAAYLVNQLGAGAAVKGVATTGRAIMGEAGAGGTGVWASSPDHYGVHARSDHGVAVRGESSDGISVLGVSPNGTAVYAQSDSGFGVVGGSSTATAVYGQSGSGTGVHGASETGYAGVFVGRIHTFAYHDMNEQATPAAPAADMARTFVRDNGSGKTELCVRFATGAVQVIATEP